MLGLYVHVPFCAAICNYCNFNRGLFDRALKDAYVSAVIEEIGRAGDGTAADTIFFGGGTPSLLDPEEISRIIGACRGAFDVTRDAEITLEANPETITPERLAGFRAVGVNRLSLGVQSFRDDELRRLSRQHSAARAIEAAAMAKEAGFANLSLDLMMWLPQQTVADWLESVETLVRLGPEHASLYLLEIYPNAPLREEMARARWSVAPDDDAADMYLEGLARLEAAGYFQYEISNVARPGYQCRHNLKYWTDGEWAGFGPGAHSTRAGIRWRNLAATGDYVTAVREGRPVAVERRVLSERERLEEAIVTGLRLVEGIDLMELGAHYGVDLWERYRQELQPFFGAGLLIYDGGRLRLTRTGMLLAHEVMAVFITLKVR